MSPLASQIMAMQLKGSAIQIAMRHWLDQELLNQAFQSHDTWWL